MTGTGTVVNGGTGSYAFEATLVAVGFILLPIVAVLISTARTSLRARRAAGRRPNLTVVRSPEPCRVCRGVGWHSQGCGLLDRLDAPAVRW